MKKCKVCDKELKLIWQTKTLMGYPEGKDSNTVKDYYQCENGHKVIELSCPDGSEPFTGGQFIGFKEIERLSK